nr:hypothetical protein [Tanacetum cinerariifolium]
MNIDDLLLKRPVEDEFQIMSVHFRSHPSHMVGEASSFLLTPQALKNLVHLFRSLGIPQNRDISRRSIFIYQTRNRIARCGFYGTPLPTDLYSPDASYADFFRESFSHPLYKKLTFIESKYIMRDLLKSFENFNPFTQIEVPLTGVSEVSSSTSSSQIASSSQIGSSTPSQLSNPDIVSSSEVRVSESTPHRFSEDTRKKWPESGYMYMRKIKIEDKRVI